MDVALCSANKTLPCWRASAKFNKFFFISQHSWWWQSRSTIQFFAPLYLPATESVTMWLVGGVVEIWHSYFPASLEKGKEKHIYFKYRIIFINFFPFKPVGDWLDLEYIVFRKDLVDGFEPQVWGVCESANSQQMQIWVAEPWHLNE